MGQTFRQMGWEDREVKVRREELLDVLKKNRAQFGLDVPESHEKAYDQIIRMMEMSVDQEITLTCSQFGCFVMDDWDWKEKWAASNSAYTRK
jgi:hypothetical protein